MYMTIDHSVNMYITLAPSVHMYMTLAYTCTVHDFSVQKFYVKLYTYYTWSIDTAPLIYFFIFLLFSLSVLGRVANVKRRKNT